MDLFAPEQREDVERYREKQKYSDVIEHKIVDRLAAGQEKFPDIITCPNDSCRSPVKVEVLDDEFRVICPNCGWQKVVKRKKFLS
ncbi:MAG: hypothetical protein ABH846_04965 [Patescibacteria group bacterium]